MYYTWVEQKATELCRAMRDRVEALEDALKDSKVKMLQQHRESQRKIEKVRYFWRNKIFEGNISIDINYIDINFILHNN